MMNESFGRKSRLENYRSEVLMRSKQAFVIADGIALVTDSAKKLTRLVSEFGMV